MTTNQRYLTKISESIDDKTTNNYLRARSLRGKNLFTVSFFTLFVSSFFLGLSDPRASSTRLTPASLCSLLFFTCSYSTNSFLAESKSSLVGRGLLPPTGNGDCDCELWDCEEYIAPMHTAFKSSYLH